jgi:hypothetical protein
LLLLAFLLFLIFLPLLAILLLLLPNASNNREPTKANISRNASNSRDAQHVEKNSCRRTVNSSRVGSLETLATTELQGCQEE